MNKSAKSLTLVSAAVSLILVFLALAPAGLAQQPAGIVPALVNFSGTLTDGNGKPLTAITGVSFLLYKDSQGGAPLWMETQNVTPDKTGHYAVQLGITRNEGLPAEVFMTGEARWLAVQVTGEAERARVLLVAVPYAMKAADAETLGGLPPSAFLLAAPANGGAAILNGAPASASASPSAPPPAMSNVTTTGGTVNAIPLFTTATNLQNSILTQTAATAVNVAGKLNLPALGAATASAGKNSRPLDFVASSFSSTTSTAVNQVFQWQAEPAANDTTAPSGTLNLLYGLGATTPAETGLKLSNKGVFTFAAGQTFPGTGAGTVKSVGLSVPASDFTVSGSPVTGTGTLNFAWTVAPDSADTANAIVKRDGSGNFTAGTVTAGTLNAVNAGLTGGLTINNNGGNAIAASSSIFNATTLYAAATYPGGSGWGIEGDTESSAGTAYGVFGQAASTTGSPIGVYGLTASGGGAGTFGQNGSLSAIGTSLSGTGTGVWGDGGSSGPYGVVGTADAGIAGYFSNNSGSFSVWAQNTNGAPFIAGYGASLGTLSAYCYIDGSGNINCSGSKNAVVPIDGGKRTVAMSAIEAPQNWFEDIGSAQLVNGAAVVTLDPDFIQTVNTDTNYKVFPVPNSDCKGLYVTNKTAHSFEVRELGGGTSNVSFDYRITVLRKKYENVRFADHTHDMDEMKKMGEQMKSRRLQDPAAVSVSAKKLPQPHRAATQVVDK